MARNDDAGTGAGRAPQYYAADPGIGAAGSVLLADDPLAEDGLAGDGSAVDGDELAVDGDELAGDELAEELLVEEISIDGMCGVY